MKDLSRIVELNCPICANNQFEYDTEIENPIYKCSDCGNEFTEEELFEANEFKINSNLDDIKEDAIKEIEKEIDKILIKFK